MSDTELTDTEAARLRQLLHRAADSLEVTTPDVDPVDLHLPTRRPGRGRWLFAAAAAVVVVVAGAVWRLSGDDADRIDTGPAEPTVTVAPQVLEQTGIWRLPEGLDGYRVVSAQGSSFASISSADRPGVLAVDDPEDPQRRLLVQAYDELGELPPDTRVVPLSDQVEVALMPTSGSTWFRVTPTGVGSGASGELVVSGSALGIDETELLELLTERFGTVESLTAAGSSTAAAESMLDDADLGGDRLVWQGGVDDPGPGGRDESVELTLVDDAGREAVVVIADGPAPRWAQIARLQMMVELMSLPNSGGPGLVEQSIRLRPDLGTGVLESSYVVPGGAPVRTLTVLTDEGVLISTSFATTTDDPDALTAPSEEQQLRIINSLRSMSEDEFRARLAELGAEFVEPETLPLTVTTTPDGTVISLPDVPED